MATTPSKKLPKIFPGLPLYFDTTIDGVQADDYEIIHQDEEISYGLVNGDGSPPDPITSKHKKLIEGLACNHHEKYWISINQFESNGKLYCPVEESGLKLAPVSLSIDSFYFDKAEFKESNKIHQDLPPYLDPDNENYAPVLDLAIQLHQAIQIEKHGNQNLSRKDRVNSWFDKNMPDEKLSGARLNMLSTMIKVKK